MTETAIDTRRQAAEARLRVIRNALEVADEELERAFVERDWEPLDFDSWEAYCAAIPEFRHFTMKVGPRRERVRRLRAAGANIPQVKVATGSSLGTIHRDLQVLEGGHSREPLSTWKDPSPTQESRADQIVRLVAARGVRGATSPEVARLARCSQGAASGCLSRLHGQGRVRPTREQRGGFGIYVVGATSS